MVCRCGHRGYTRARLHSLSCLVLSWHSYVTKLRHCRAMYTDLRRQPRQCKGVLRTCPNSERSRSETAERTASSQKVTRAFTSEMRLLICRLYELEGSFGDTNVAAIQDGEQSTTTTLPLATSTLAVPQTW